MKEYRSRLLLGLVILVSAVFAALGIFLGQLIKNTYLHSLDSRLSKESQLISNYIQNNGGILNINEKQIDHFHDKLGSEIVILDHKGELIYSTDSSTVSGNNGPKLIQQIFDAKLRPGENGDTIRKQDENYVHIYWAPIYENKETTGYVFLKTKLTSLEEAYQKMWWLLGATFVMALLIVVPIAVRMTSIFTQPIESAAKVASELAQGNYRARTYDYNIGEVGNLNTSINILAKNLELLEKTREMQKDRLKTIIKYMGSALLLIDSRGYISLINDAYKEIFHVKEEEYLNKLYYEVIEQEDVIKLIEEIFMTEQKTRRHFIHPIFIERHHFEVYGAPILSNDDVWKGVLLVFHDITEIVRLEQIRKDFVANVSHELKTPITSIKGFTETLLDGAMNDEKALNDFLHIILKESSRMQNLIQDLLDLSKLEQEGYKLNINRIDMVPLLKEVLQVLKGKAEEKNILLTYETTDNQVYLTGDPARLKQVLINLITNGISYTPNGGQVSISLTQGKNTVVVKVMDTGIGIEKSEIPRIFERFYRVDKARSRNSGGTGLGLAIVKHIVEAHRGKISVESKEGKGTVFTVELKKDITNE